MNSVVSELAGEEVQVVVGSQQFEAKVHKVHECGTQVSVRYKDWADAILRQLPPQVTMDMLLLRPLTKRLS
jgi:hypothetical protein